ncbi:MAG: hypothetical protein IT314_13765 [Anaerolineales bacterium]|nr:hypothetical protein [Anaerolineales bacterium]
MDGMQVQFGFEGKVIEFGVAFEQFQFDIPAQGGEEMVGLGCDRLGRRLLQRSILFERLVIGFHIPSFLVECGDPVTVQGGIVK